MEMPNRVVLTIVLLALTAFAGCAGKNTSGKNGSAADSAAALDHAVQGIDVKATATTGIIRGVVVDSGIRPIVNAVLSVQTTERILYTNSTATGAFGFDGLKPGTYFVKAHKPGFVDAQTSSDVQAGLADPAVLKILLTVDSTFVRPYFSIEQHKGYVQCGGAATVPGVASGYLSACSTVNVAGNAPCSFGAPCPGNLTSDDFLTFYNYNPLPDYMVSELIWESTSPAGNQLDLQYAYSGCTGQLCVANSTAGPSPIQISINKAELQNLKLMGGNGTDMGIRIFPATAAESQGTVGLTFQQPFTVYTVLTYGFTPPSGYSFSVDGEPKVPSS